jgi:hypothetical protein
MSEFYRYSPPEAEKPAPLTVENQVERLEHSKTPEVKKDTKFEPSEEDVQDATLSAQRRLKEFGITGKSAMQGDATQESPSAPPAPTDTRQDGS